MKLDKFAAYHGPGWRNRPGTLAADVAGGAIWAPHRCDAEWSRLLDVVLYLPGPAIGSLDDVDASLHVAPIDPARLRRQHERIVTVYESLGVRVRPVDGTAVDDRRYPNLMFQRDLFWMTPAGAVIARAASPVRAGEERFAARTLAERDVPIALTVGGSGTFEGADALWLAPRHVLLGSGVRSNAAGLEQLRALLRAIGVESTVVPVRGQVQHLLGCVQVVAPNRALVRSAAADPAVPRVLRAAGLEVVDVGESDEITRRLAFNFVVVDRETVVVTDDAPEFCRFLERHAVNVAATVATSEYVKAAGGLGCATGILSRRPVSV